MNIMMMMMMMMMMMIYNETNIFDRMSFKIIKNKIKSKYWLFL